MNILKKIIFNKKTWLEKKKIFQPLNTFDFLIKKSNRNFKETLKKKRPFFILECKKASPSLGPINSKFNIKKILKTYKNYANAISVLTDEKYFQGKFEHLLQAHKTTTQPLLCKDFFIDPYQVFLARHYKADAILLILSILSDSQYLELSSIAKKLNMDFITEVNNEHELERANILKAPIIGINNRNLNDLSITLEKTKILAPKVRKESLIISESGLSNYQDIRQLSNIVHGFLIGSSLMKSKNLDSKIKSIFFGKNKVCGLTNYHDANLACTSGSVYGGLIFIKSSIRNISKNLALKITRETRLKYIAVFKDVNLSVILSLIQDLPIHAIQLHGNENEYYIKCLRKKLPTNIKIWKAISMSNKFLARTNLQYIDRYVFDNGIGGTGTTFDWSKLKKFKLKNVILAGGINKKNCTYASKLGCLGLDLNSGVEKRAGIKDRKKLLSIFKKLRYYQ